MHHWPSTARWRTKGERERVSGVAMIWNDTWPVTKIHLLMRFYDPMDLVKPNLFWFIWAEVSFLNMCWPLAKGEEGECEERREKKNKFDLLLIRDCKFISGSWPGWLSNSTRTFTQQLHLNPKALEHLEVALPVLVVIIAHACQWGS